MHRGISFVGTLAAMALTLTAQDASAQTYAWSAGPWATCGTSCQQPRFVQCVESGGAVVSDALCLEPRPADLQSCFGGSCLAVWTVGPWSACSQPCGAGSQTRVLRCVLEGTDVDTACCDPALAPASVQACNVAACPTYSWNAGAWSACSVSCGGGTQGRTVTCVEDGTGTIVADALCVGTKPATVQACNVAACATYAWSTGAWSACSVSCGGGTQGRTVTCVDGTGVIVADALCVGAKPATGQACNVAACPTYAWSAGAWSDCSVSCGGGWQVRVVECRDQTSALVESALCGTATRPSAGQSCNPEPCPSYAWTTGAWSACSAACGGGSQSRTVACVADGSGDVVADALCTATKPAAVQGCNVAACPTYAWSAGAWSECSASCGDGWQVRVVECRDQGSALAESSLCEQTTKPAAAQPCSKQPCPTQWVAGQWGACPVSCGGGTQVRPVECRDSLGGLVEGQRCPAETRPVESQVCGTEPCPAYAWKTGEWSACSAACAGGTWTREVSCVDGAGAKAAEESCDPATKPAVSEPCNVLACPTHQWTAGRWSECSALCGDGSQVRVVTCNSDTGRVVDDSLCLGQRPGDRQDCEEEVCATSGCSQPGSAPAALVALVVFALARRRRVGTS